jgi:hypothetical protein
MKKRSLGLEINSLVLAFIIGAVPASFIGGFVDDTKDRGAVTGLVWLLVATPAFLILREREE